MATAIWKGNLTGFGMINLPINLYKTIDEPQTIEFNEINPKTGNRISQQRVDSATGEAVEKTVKGTRLNDGTYVLFDREELAEAMPEKSTTLKIISFTDEDTIDPIYLDVPYAIGTSEGNQNTYGLLLESMRATGKVAFGRFVLRGREYLCLIRATPQGLVLTTLRWAQQIRHINQLTPQQYEVSDQELLLASTLIDHMSSEVDISQFHDEWNEKMMTLIEAKISQEQPIADSKSSASEEGKKKEDSAEDDLLSALRASLDMAKKDAV